MLLNSNVNKILHHVKMLILHVQCIT